MLRNSLLILALGLSGCALLRTGETTCDVCFRPVHSQTEYRITLEDGSEKVLCCPRCGLHFLKQNPAVKDLKVADYRGGELIDAKEAVYVENSSVMFCCRAKPLERDRSGAQYQLGWDRCMPSLVAFKSRNEAELFRRGQGGTVKTYGELSAEF